MAVEGIHKCQSYWFGTGFPEMLAVDRPPSDTGDGIRRCLLVEFNRMHGEVLAGLYGFFSNMGYSVDVLVRPSLLTERFGDPFALFGRPPRTYRLTMIPFEDRIALMRAIKGPDLVIPQHRA